MYPYSIKKCFYGWPFYNLIDHKSILSVFDISYGHECGGIKAYVRAHAYDG